MQQLPLFNTLPDLHGKRVLLRLDLNVPLENGAVRDAYRIDQSLPTIEYLRDRGARVVIIAHIGKGKPSDTLAPVAEYLNRKFPVTFLDSLMSPENERVTKMMNEGDVVLIENLRHNIGEENNDAEFARYLSTLGDIYVNDAFSVSHRAHASVVGVALLLPHYAGMLMEQEIKHLSVAFHPEHPFLFILGGAKISTKMPLLKKFLNTADNVFVGGAIANNFLKVAGREIGRSVYDPDELEGLEESMKHECLIIPGDVVVQNESGAASKKVSEVTQEDMIVDIGRETIQDLEGVIGGARLIVWNGPLGYYENGFTDGTRELLGLIAGSSAMSIIGGGDTVALIDEMGAHDRFTFVSTAGGAMLDFLANETLPGIEALLV